MILFNTPSIADLTITRGLGLVTGNVVQSKLLGQDFAVGLKALVGGEISGYTEMLAEARRMA